jgi:ribosomal-protein-alanine N-acetyltransferase
VILTPSALPSLRTERLCLRPSSTDDADWLHELLVNPDVRRFLCDDRIIDRHEVQTIVDHAVALASRGLGMWIVESGGRAPIGFAGLHPISEFEATARPDFAGEIEPTIALHPTAQGRGLATEALNAVLRYGFAAHCPARIVAFADEPNGASRRLMARLGFIDVGDCAGPRFRLRCFELRPNTTGFQSRAP